jgi:hypothetical protein
MYTCKWCGRSIQTVSGCCGLKCEREYRAATYTPPDSGAGAGCIIPSLLVIISPGLLFMFNNAKWKWNEIIAFVAIGVIVLVGLCKIVAILGEKDTDDPG